MDILPLGELTIEILRFSEAVGQAQKPDRLLMLVWPLVPIYNRMQHDWRTTLHANKMTKSE